MPFELKRRPRTAKIVFLERLGDRGEVACDQTMDNKEDKKGNHERLDGLTDHNDRHSGEKPAIDLVERGFNHKNAEQTFGAAIRIKNSELAPRGRVSQVGASGHYERSRCGSIGNLAQFDIADFRQSKNPLDLQLELAPIQSPETVAKALTIDAIDLGHSQIDSLDIAAIVEVELRQCQKQRDHRTEEKDTNEKAPAKTAEAAPERAPYGGNAPQRR